MNYTNRILASLVAAVFILSLFSGFAAAQTPEEQYKLHKEKYENTKKRFEDAKGIFEKARERLGNANDIRSKEELNNRTKDYLLRAIDQTISHLEILKDRVELRENKEIIKFDATGVIEAQISQLEGMKVDVEQAETTQDFRAIYTELKDMWVNIRLETRYYIGIVLNYRINGFLEKVDSVSIKMDDAITKLENKGIDTTKLEAEADKFDSIVAEAEANQQKTDDLFEEHNGFSDGKVTDISAAREFLNQGDELERGTVKMIKEGAKQLKDFVKEFRKLARGKVTIEGASTETFSGN
ncbi:MAG: hypothetical protein D4R88_09855 [Methanosarcinales archaeon]|nr:MAG: hypothetical protein D4R88_09855 [Methanosarcinales archaeon]